MDGRTPTLEFWFEFASTYSYPAAMRVEARARAEDLAIEWRPFLLGPIFQAQGWNDSPFNVYPVKGRYMWRDLERVCAKERLTLQRPSRFPRPSLVAARVACIGAREPWGPTFVRAVYSANFAADREIGDAAVIADVLTEIGVDAPTTLARAESPDVKAALRANTDEAIALGIFGAPSFVVAGELFWGNDRLDDALAAARTRGR
jgi:2-hydroxychromene-2-carboxylate isomerase